MASNRRKYLKRTRRARMRELSPSPAGFTSMGLSFAAVVMLVTSVVLSFRMRGEGTLYVGSIGLLGLVLAVGSLALGIVSLRQPKVRPIPGRIGSVTGGILTIFFVALYIIGILF